MLRSLLLFAALLIAGCGDSSEPPDTPEAPADDSTAETTSTAATIEPLVAPDQAPEPSGSLGAFTLDYVYTIEDEDENEFKDTLRLEGFLPPAMPADARASTAFSTPDDYYPNVSPEGLPEATDLNALGSYVHIVIPSDPEARLDGSARTAEFSLREDGQFPIEGTVYAFSFAPLWTGPLDLSPSLVIRGADKESVLTELPLPLSDTPDWAQPISFPSPPVGTDIDYELTLTGVSENLVPVLVYPGRFGDGGWGASPLSIDTFQQRFGDETTEGTPYKGWFPFIDSQNPRGFLVLMPR
ncbi:MAG: hypothetical protein AAF170_02685 [Bacteroidota bacterium]